MPEPGFGGSSAGSGMGAGTGRDEDHVDDKDIVGIGYDISAASHPTLGSINMKIGAYLQDENKFEDYRIQTPLGCDIMPIIGLEFNLPYNDKWGISTLIPPALTFTGIRFTFQ